MEELLVVLVLVVGVGAVAALVLPLVALVQMGSLSRRVRSLEERLRRVEAGAKAGASERVITQAGAVTQVKPSMGARDESTPMARGMRERREETRADEASGPDAVPREPAAVEPVITPLPARDVTPPVDEEAAHRDADAEVIGASDDDEIEYVESEVDREEEWSRLAAASTPAHAKPRAGVSGSITAATSWAWLEERIGSHLFIWIGGVALLLAGAFLVKYGFEHNVLPDWARLCIAAAFGIALIGASEWMKNKSERIAQSLCGAGIADLYGVILGATLLYGLMSSTVAFILMTLVTAAAVALSLRHGRPVAIIGLLGGYGMPALIGGDSNSTLPLFAYLLVLEVGLTAVSRHRGWIGLATVNLAASMGWAALYTLTRLADGATLNSTVIGGFVLLSVASFLVAATITRGRAEGDGERTKGAANAWLLGLGSVVSGLTVLVVLAWVGRFGHVELGMLAALSVGTLVLARLDRLSMPLPWAALGLCVVTLLAWPLSMSNGLWAGGGVGPTFPGGRYGAWSGVFWVLFVFGGYALLWPITLAWLGGVRRRIAAVSGAMVAVDLINAEGEGGEGARRDTGAGVDSASRPHTPGAVLSVVAAHALIAVVIVGCDIADVSPPVAWWWAPAGGAAVLALMAVGALANRGWRGRLNEEAKVWEPAAAALTLGCAGLVTWAVGAGWDAPWQAVAWAAGVWVAVEAADYLKLWPLLYAAAWGAGLAGLAMVAQLLGGTAGDWNFFMLLAAYGLPAAALLGASWRVSIAPSPTPNEAPTLGKPRGSDATLAIALRAAGLIAAVLTLVLLVRRVFHPEESVVYSWVEWLEWGTLAIVLLAAGLGLWRYGRRLEDVAMEYGGASAGLLGTAAAVLGAGSISNPLWTPEAIVSGPPVLNLLLIVYGVPAAIIGGWALLLRNIGGDEKRIAAPAVGAVALLLLFGLVTLAVRQAFAGEVLDVQRVSVSSGEWYAYSLVWIVLGSAMLAAGVALRSVALRYGSAAVMLLAVAKVFVLDTAKLEDLWRVMSYFGLGVVLIALGYVYQRWVFRRSDKADEASEGGPETTP